MTFCGCGIVKKSISENLAKGKKKLRYSEPLIVFSVYLEQFLTLWRCCLINHTESSEVFIIDTYELVVLS